MTLRRFGITLGTAVALAWPQTEPPARLAFDVASIKPAAAGEAEIGYRFEPGGRTVVSNFPLGSLILVGWHILPFQIVGGLGWLNSEGYDIEAKAAGDPDVGQSRIMIQSLLAERFHLVIHRETRVLPMYALVPAKGNRPGTGLVRAKDGACTPASQDFPPPPLDAGKPAYCGVTQQFRRQDNGVALMQLTGRGATISMLARNLASVVDKHVADETGMAGSYDMRMEYTPYDDSLAPKPDTGVPALFTALQEQLGLKLNSRKGPVEVFVIDHAERPSDN